MMVLKGRGIPPFYKIPEDRRTVITELQSGGEGKGRPGVRRWGRNLGARAMCPGFPERFLKNRCGKGPVCHHISDRGFLSSKHSLCTQMTRTMSKSSYRRHLAQLPQVGIRRQAGT